MAVEDPVQVTVKVSHCESDLRPNLHVARIRD